MDHSFTGRCIARRLGVGGLLVLALALGASPACAAIGFVVDTSDGEFYLTNPTGFAAVIDGYAISSASGALLPANWTTVTTFYDASGDLSVDSTANWFLLGAPTTGSLAEASAVIGSGRVAANGYIALGDIFNLINPQDLQVLVTGNNVTVAAVGDYRNLLADYDTDLDVDVDDYFVFADTFGSAIDLRADGNHNGLVDTGDYTIWRDSPELSPALVLNFSPPALALGVPEPGAALLAIASLAGLAASRRRR